MISIHALREEGDYRENKRLMEELISIHALREEGDVKKQISQAFLPNFYPRPPRGGRLPRKQAVDGRAYFYPRPPRGGRLLLFQRRPGAVKISIHALREEGDTDL